MKPPWDTSIADTVTSSEWQSDLLKMWIFADRCMWFFGGVACGIFLVAVSK